MLDVSQIYSVCPSHLQGLIWNFFEIGSRPICKILKSVVSSYLCVSKLTVFKFHSVGECDVFQFFFQLSKIWSFFHLTRKQRCKQCFLCSSFPSSSFPHCVILIQRALEKSVLSFPATVVFWTHSSFQSRRGRYRHVSLTWFTSSIRNNVVSRRGDGWLFTYPHYIQQLLYLAFDNK